MKETRAPLKEADLSGWKAEQVGDIHEWPLFSVDQYSAKKI